MENFSKKHDPVQCGHSSLNTTGQEIGCHLTPCELELCSTCHLGPYFNCNDKTMPRVNAMLAFKMTALNVRNADR